MKTYNRLQLLGKVASLYYEENRSQAEIARQLGYSRSAISRILQEAHEKGVVEIRIHYPVERSFYHESLLKQVFGLKDAYVVICSEEDLDQRIRLLGQTGVEAVMDYLHEDSTIGITWGHAIYEFVHAVRPRKWHDSKVVQMMGALGKEGRYFDGPSLTLSLSEALGGKHYIPYVPLMVESDEVYQGLSNQPNIREVLGMTSKMDVAVMGIGSVDPEYSGVFRAGYLTIDEMDEVHQRGAVGELSGYYYDINGNIMEAEFYSRLFSSDIRNLVKSSCMTFGIAGGKHKVLPIVGALRGHFLDVLITDEEAAEEALKMANRLMV